MSAAWIAGFLHAASAVVAPQALRASMTRSQVGALTPFWIQGFLLPASVFLVGAQFFDGIRHLLFLVPALIVVATLGIAWLMGPGTNTRKGVVTVSILGLLVAGANLWADIRWFPYDYAFINPLAGHDKSSRQWELDYWGISAREGVERLRELGVAPVVVVPTGEPGRPYGALNLTDPGAGIEDPVIIRTKPGEEFGYYWFRRFQYPLADFDCVKLFSIVRDGQDLGEGGRCRVPTATRDGS
jgi:hypothetical protein